MPQNKLERRIFTIGKLEARDANEKRSIVGHAAVFEKPTSLGYFNETVAPGAFKNSIKADDIRALFNHDPNFVLGRNTAGTLRLSEDDIGLAIEIDPPDTQFARDLGVSIGRGDITQMSFGFETIAEEWRQDKDGDWQRTLIEVKLWDVSPVTFPAYAETDVGMRSLEAYRKTIVRAAAPISLLMRRQKLLETTF